MFEYQKRILELECEFRSTMRDLKALLRKHRYKPGSIRPGEIKAHLGLVNAMTRLIKEETAFYAKVGQLYDVALLVSDIYKLLQHQDPEKADAFMDEINEMWMSREVKKPPE